MPVDERVARSVALEQAYVHDVYEQFYDNPRSKPWPKVQQFLQDLEPGSLVCDVGCGNGKYLNVNSSIFNIGGDKSMRLTEVAREKENEVIVLDNLALPFKDESLDAVLSIAVVHHLATTERRICALRELARVLRIGGRLIISVWAMEQSHRKFESQDVLVPWRRPKHLSTPSLELTSTTNTSEDDCLPPYHAYTQTSDSDSNRSMKSKSMARKKGKSRKGRSIDPGRNSSPSSSSLSSPNETCYSFVRRAIQKLAGGGRRVGVHRPWFLESWSTCGAKESTSRHHQRYDHNQCDCCDCNENIQDIPIELRRIDDDSEIPQQRRQTFPSSMLINDLAANLKSKSMTNIKTVENKEVVIRSQSSTPTIPEADIADGISQQNHQQQQQSQENLNKPKPITLAKPKLVKQKKSICEEDDEEESLDQPTDMKILINNLPSFQVFNNRYSSRGGVFKQHSLNEELMSTDRLKEKERVRQNIQKQASLNEDLIYQQRHHHPNHHNNQHHTFDTFKDSLFSVSTSKRFQLIKTGFTNKIKNSTTNIEKVTSQSLRNGFVRIFQNWKNPDLISPTIIPEDEPVESSITKIVIEEKKEVVTERRHSKEDGSDSSKDSSLQSDTSVDSEDSFASVIFVPKSDPMSPTPLSPGPISPRLKTNNSLPNSPRIKQSSCPTSPRIKQMPLTIYPLQKQLSSPKPTTADLLSSTLSSPISSDKSERDQIKESTTITQQTTSIINNNKTLAQKYSVPQIPKFRRTSLNSSSPPSNNSVNNNNSNNNNNNSVSPEKSPVEKQQQQQQDTRNERLKKIKELLTQKPGFGVRCSSTTSMPKSSKSSSSNYPIVRHSSITNGKIEAIAKPLPKLLSLELFNPETDDKDSDSSCVSSPDSIDSVINVRSNEDQKYSTTTTTKTTKSTKFKFPPHPLPPPLSTQSEAEAEITKKSLLEAAADVAQTLDQAVDKMIKSSPRTKRKLQSSEVLSIIQRKYSTTDTTPLLTKESEPSCHGDYSGPSWDEDCHKHLTDFADKLSEKLLKEIDQYQEKSKERIHLSTSSSMDNIDDPYIHRLSEELDDLSKLSAEIQKQNEYLAKLSASDSLFIRQCKKCKEIDDCKCCGARRTSKTNVNNNNNNNNNNNTKNNKREVNKQNDKPGTNNNNNTSNSGSNPKCDMDKSQTNDDLNNSDKDREKSEKTSVECDSNLGTVCKLSVSKTSIKMGTSTDSCDSEKGSSTNSMISSVATSINFGQSMESNDGFSDKFSNESHKDTNSISRYSDGGSTASLASCPEWKTIKSSSATKTSSQQHLNHHDDDRLMMMKNDNSSISLESDFSSSSLSYKRRGGGGGGSGGGHGGSSGGIGGEKSVLYSDTSQDSLPSDNIGGEITYHRYYHVFREGELDQLIEKYVENLHIISSYYDHASWCIIAEKVQVWTI